MLNGQEWQHRHQDFITETQRLLSRSQECLTHLTLFSNDQDAVDCLLTTLLALAQKADQAAIACMADLCRQLRRLLSVAYPSTSLQDEALQTLNDCFSLLAWQVELIDPRSGQLALDDSEQRELLEKFAYLSGLGNPQASPSQRLAWASALHMKADAAFESARRSPRL